ncbi:MAG: sodium ion-translocating decarboxylase subunit beta, partial [Victivallaceae bacterium]|nr:sodium ion-translocating decarboxylase subunit beta [Victivallaceae bacterium]
MKLTKIMAFTLCLLLSGLFLAAAEVEIKPAGKQLNENAAKVFAWSKTPDGQLHLIYTWPKPATVYSVSVTKGQKLLPGREIMILAVEGRSKATVVITEAMQVTDLNKKLESANTVEFGDVIMSAQPAKLFQDSVSKSAQGAEKLPTWNVLAEKLWHSTGIYDIIRQTSADPAHTWHLGVGRVLMMLVGVLLIGLAIFKGFEPLLLLPIGFGAILANIPIAAIA